ncbi:MAG: signal peptidase II [Myxococcales bacterium]|nr:signal peptidase II [Myxococcales bacterium]
MSEVIEAEGQGTAANSSSESGLLASPEAESGLLASQEAESGLLASPEAESGLLASPEAESGLLASPEAESGLLASPEAESASRSARDETLSAAASGADGVLPLAVELPYRPSLIFFVVVAFINVVLDLASKQWIKAFFEDPLNERRKIVLVDGFAQLIYATNKGGAWGILQSEHESLRRPFFLIVSVAAVVFIVSLYRKVAREQTALRWGLPLVLGGAVGNFVDRVLYGAVIDFIDVYVTTGGTEKHWPTFNIADIAICVGVGLMAVDMFTTRPAPTKAAEQPASPEPR